MKDFILLMHADTQARKPPELWAAYFEKLRALGAFEGGSAIGAGEAIRKSGEPAPMTHSIAGYIRVRARSLADAKALVVGNPAFEAGATIEVRELPRE